MSIELLKIDIFIFVMNCFFVFFINYNIKGPIFLRFCTFLVLLLREFFYVFPSYGIFFLKIYTLCTFLKFLKIIILILKHSGKKSTIFQKMQQIVQVFLAMTQITFFKSFELKKSWVIIINFIFENPFEV